MYIWESVVDVADVVGKKRLMMPQQSSMSELTVVSCCILSGLKVGRLP